jgi:hypothetical protein
MWEFVADWVNFCLRQVVASYGDVGKKERYYFQSANFPFVVKLPALLMASRLRVLIPSSGLEYKIYAKK